MEPGRQVEWKDGLSVKDIEAPYLKMVLLVIHGDYEDRKGMFYQEKMAEPIPLRYLGNQSR